MNKPREFWIDSNDEDGLYIARDSIQTRGIHVIEYSAYEELSEQMAGNFCGYCWRKESDGPTVGEWGKLTEQNKIMRGALETVCSRMTNAGLAGQWLYDATKALSRCSGDSDETAK